MLGLGVVLVLVGIIGGVFAERNQRWWALSVVGMVMVTVSVL